jgi:adenylate kinase
MAIIVTGTPATGKTTLAKRLAREKGYEYLDLNEFSRTAGAIEGRDEQRDTDVVDEQKVIKAIVNAIKKNPRVVIDGHFSQEIPAEYVEACYVTKTKLPELKRRLEARRYSEQKVRENLDSEIFDTCRIEAEEKGHKVQVVWT